MSESYVGPFPFEEREEFGGCLCNRAGRRSNSMDGLPSFMPAFADMELMLANCFDDFGSDTVAHDPQDDEHNYWVDVYECSDDLIPAEFVEDVDADDYYADVFGQLVEAGLAKEDEKDFYLGFDANDDEVLTSTCVPGTITWAQFFDAEEMEPVKTGTINTSVRKPVAADTNVRGGKKFVWKRVKFAVEVSVRKHRHHDPYSEYHRPTLDGVHVL